MNILRKDGEISGAAAFISLHGILSKHKALSVYSCFIIFATVLVLVGFIVKLHLAGVRYFSKWLSSSGKSFAREDRISVKCLFMQLGNILWFSKYLAVSYKLINGRIRRLST